MKRYFNLNDNTYNHYCDEIEPSYMVEIPDDGKPYGMVNGEIIDISETDEYKLNIAAKEKESKINELTEQINEIDKKRIRAGFEPAIKDEITGQTYLEYYTAQIIELRNQISSL